MRRAKLLRNVEAISVQRDERHSRMVKHHTCNRHLRVKVDALASFA